MRKPTPLTDAIEQEVHAKGMYPSKQSIYHRLIYLCRQLELQVEEHRYEKIEHDELGCPVAKTGIYAPKPD